jgi:hypothetical protein
MLVFLDMSVAHNQKEASEYVAKAAFLERFTRFTEWPPKSQMSDTSKPFVISVIGEDPFGSVLRDICAEQKIKHKPVKVRNINEIEEINGTNLLFISSSEKERIEKVIDYTQEKPILTVGDTQGFGEKGVHINFYLEGDSLRFTINQTAVKNSGLSISYLLLEVAKVINPVGG